VKIKSEPLDAIRPHPGNPRRNHDLDRLTASIREFGFRVPIIVDHEGVIVTGHGRHLAAQKLGLKTVPVHRLAEDELTPVQIAAYRIMDNKSAEGSEWDEALLLSQIDELIGMGADPDLAGFEDAEVDALRRLVEQMQADERDPSEDDAPAVPEQPVSRPGDLWTLGDHLILCGDATKAEDIARLGDHGHLMVTDPPYGVGYDPKWRAEAAAKGLINYGIRADGRVVNDDRVDWETALRLFEGHVLYIWHAGIMAATVQSMLIACGFITRSQIIWAKSRFCISRGHYHWQHEPCWYAVRKGQPSHWTKARDQTTLWTVGTLNVFNRAESENSFTGHGTQKPVEVMRRPMLNNSNQGDLVYDPFVGSGSTIIAAESVGRRCRAIEIDPAYVDVCVRRWQDFTGKTAVLDEGGTFEEIAAVRLGTAAVAITEPGTR
jgi:DNA modification methylase